MKKINAEAIASAVRGLCISANYELVDDVLEALRKAKTSEESPLAEEILDQIIENAVIAKNEQVPICQDTGFAVVFVELGQDVVIEDGNLQEAIQEGVRQGYGDGYLRKSIVQDPLVRKNTGDNTPAVIYTDIVPGEKLKITVAPKGGGSENMSAVAMLKPADGIEGVREFVIGQVSRAGGNPCPPIVVGVGIGGTFEKCAMLAKRALLRTIGSRHPESRYADLEAELLTRINKLGVGPQGLGGRTTALAVHVEVFPCHIASLPVAVNINCHAARHAEVIL
jgi:fumarate hydratase subunit alpha